MSFASGSSARACRTSASRRGRSTMIKRALAIAGRTSRSSHGTSVAAWYGDRMKRRALLVAAMLLAGCGSSDPKATAPTGDGANASARHKSTRAHREVHARRLRISMRSGSRRRAGDARSVRWIRRSHRAHAAHHAAAHAFGRRRSRHRNGSLLRHSDHARGADIFESSASTELAFVSTVFDET